MTDSKEELVKQFFGKTSKSYEKMVNLTTFRKDNYWKKEIIKKINPNCNSILDLACGTGILTFKIAKIFPRINIIGVDITERYLNLAKQKLESNHKIIFFLADAEKINLNTKFDCITSSYIPKYCTPNVLIAKCLDHLNPNGRIILHDFTYPKNRITQKIWNFYCYLLKILGYCIPNWKSVFEDLPNIIKSSNWIAEYKNIMNQNGLDVQVHYLTLSTSAILVGTKKF